MTKNKLIFFALIGGSILILSAFDRTSAPGAVADYPRSPIPMDASMCSSCHEDIVKDYGETDKSSSFLRPVAERIIEDFDVPAYFHKPSKSYFDMIWANDTMVFVRYQLNDLDQKINIIRQKVDWILGSGDDLRSYLYQTANGEMFQLPLAWYNDLSRWDMAPGFVNTLDVSILKPVGAACLFCHNAYPEEVTDQLWNATYFDHNLPQGIDCARCHGNPQAHLALALSDTAETFEIRQSIINPARLDKRKRDDVCNQCHLQPTVAVDAIQIFGRGPFSFQPGELLSDFRVDIDITNVQRNGERSFEMNHHAYQLYESKCYQASSIEMSCTSCHDPHRKIDPVEKTEFYRQKCMNCHESRDLISAHEWAGESDAKSDCVSCHMPLRRTHDYIHVTTTDHRIRIVENTKELVMEREEEDMITRNVMTYNLPAPDSSFKLYLALAILKMNKKPHILDYVKNMVDDFDGPEIDPMLYVAEAEIALGRYEAAIKTLDIVLGNELTNKIAIEWKGLALMKLNRMEEASPYIEKAVESSSVRAETFYNLGLLRYIQEDWNAAEKAFNHSIELRENMFMSWYYLAKLKLELTEFKEAEAFAKNALEIDPVHTRSYLVLKEALISQGKIDMARSYLEHAYKIVPNELIISRELAKISK